MKRLNEKGFAISTVIYGLSIMGIMIVAVLLAVMAQNRTNTRQLAKTIEDELNEHNKINRQKLTTQSFITGNGTSDYIDTGYTPTPTTGISIKYKIKSTTNYQRLFGTGDSLYYQVYTYNSKIRYEYSNTDAYVETTATIDTNTIHVLRFNVGNNKKILIDTANTNNGSILNADITSTPTNTAGDTLQILHYSSGTVYLNADIYEVNIYEGTETNPVREFIPVKRNDGVYGLYEKKEKEFHSLNHTIEAVPDGAISLP